MCSKNITYVISVIFEAALKQLPVQAFPYYRCTAALRTGACLRLPSKLPAVATFELTCS